MKFHLHAILFNSIHFIQFFWELLVECFVPAPKIVKRKTNNKRMLSTWCESFVLHVDVSYEGEKKNNRIASQYEISFWALMRRQTNSFIWIRYANVNEIIDIEIFLHHHRTFTHIHTYILINMTFKFGCNFFLSRFSTCLCLGLGLNVSLFSIRMTLALSCIPHMNSVAQNSY